MRCLSYETRCRMCREYVDPSQGRWEVGDPIEDRRVGVPVLHSRETEVHGNFRPNLRASISGV